VNKLASSLETAPIVKKGSYRYVVHPLTDGIPAIEPDLLREVTDALRKHLPRCTRIVTMEAMGIPLATALSLATGVPFTIIRKRRYGLPGELEVTQKTGYSTTRLYVNGLSAGDEVVIVDDVLSTGGTLVAVVRTLKEMGVAIRGILIAINKGDKERVERDIGMPVTTLVDIAVNDAVTIL
jgi:adenine phosphoribosyltransferase